MSWSFWVNLGVCFGSAVYALFEHSEIRLEFKEALTKSEKWKTGTKLFLLWAVPLGTFAGIIISVFESVSSEKSVTEQRGSIESISNRAVRAEASASDATGRIAWLVKQGESTSNVLVLTAQTLEKASNAIRLAKRTPEPRHLLEQQRAIILETLKSLPKGKVRIDGSGSDSEVMDYKAEIVNALKASGFTVQNVNASFMFDSATTMQLPSGMELSFHAREDNNREDRQ